MMVRRELLRSVLLMLALSLIPPVAAAEPVSNEISVANEQVGVAAHPRIPTRDFARLPDFSDAKISPDGSRLVFRLRANGKVQIGHRLVDGGPTSGFAIPDGMELRWIRWAGNNQILVSVQTVAYVFGIEVPRTTLMLYSIATGETRLLTLHNDGKGKASNPGLIGDDVLYVAPDGSRLLMAMNKDLFGNPSVFDVSLPDGKMTEIVRARNSISDWFADNQGIVRVGIGWDAGKLRLIYRTDASADFQTIARLDPNKEESWFSLAQIVTGSDEGYVLSDAATGRVAVHRFNYRTREIGELVYGHDRFDIAGYELSEDGRTLRAVYYTDDRDRVVWMDAAEKRTQAMIDRAVPHLQAWTVSRSSDQSKLLIYGTATNDPGVWYVLDRATRQMAILATEYEGLPPEQLATTTEISYKSRDGMDIPAYLTLPKGRAAKGLPLIIHPHGGPYGVRDKLAYDPQVQFFANRGYAVLQPNYRGSGGYGTAFGDAGVGQIGRGMQNDLDDGMDWLAGQGIIDPARTCIVGASYGGYAAIWGIIRNPERYRCAASFAGVADWESMLKYDRRFLTKKASDKWRARITGEGDLTLKDVSATKAASSLTRPLLLAHGDQDSNVPISQSEKFLAAVPKPRRDLVTFHEFEGEGHSFADPTNFQIWLDKLDAFLAEHNPAS